MHAAFCPCPFRFIVFWYVAVFFHAELNKDCDALINFELSRDQLLECETEADSTTEDNPVKTPKVDTSVSTKGKKPKRMKGLVKEKKTSLRWKLL